jgi:zinc protease
MKRLSRHLMPLVLLLAATSGWGQSTAVATGPAPTSKIEKVTSVEGITEYRLTNGLRVLLFPDQTKPTITVNITYLVGSRHEGYGETGMAHLLEHLVFKGTPKHPNIPQELTAHGARPNGTTWYDRTNYFETFSASDENLEWALDLEADRMVNSFIAKKDLDSEMTVVRNEFEMGENSPMSIMEERALSTAYLWHNYGNSTIGARADLENVPIDRLQAFYRNYYQPDNAILLVAGKFDEAKTLKLIEKYFAPIPKPARTLQHTYTAEPVQDGERSVVLRRVGDVQGATAVYHVPAGSHPDFPAVDLLAQIMGDVPSGRLHKALVETKKATSVAGYGYQLREPGVAIFMAELRQDGNLQEVTDTLIKTVEGAVTAPPTAEEVERARTALLKAIELMLNRSDRVGLELSEWAAMGDWRLFFLHRDRLRTAKAEDVARVAKAYLKPSNRTVAQFIPTQKPDRAEIPAPPNVAELVKDYKGDPNVKLGEAFDPSTTNIERRTTRSTLPNGLEIALLPKETRGGTVVASMAFRFGDEKSLMHRVTAAQLAGSMLMRGTKKHTRQQIKDEFDRLKARVNVGGGATEAAVGIETTRENLPAVLRLVAEILREPAFPADEFEQLRQQMLAGAEEQRSDPQSIAVTEGSRIMNPYPRGDVRYISTPDEDIAELKAVKLDELKKFYDEFYGASNAQLTVVGDFDPKEATALVTELFGTWKSGKPFNRVTRSYMAIAPVHRAIETPDKANAVYFATLNLDLRDDDPDYPALVLGNYMLGGGFLNSRLATRIRQKEGISYGVGSGVSASSLDRYGTFRIFAIFAPENAGRLEAAVKEELARMLKEGFTAEEVAAAKSGWLQAQQVSRSQDAELARRLNSYLFIDRTLEWDAAFEKKVEALTPQGIVEAMRKHITADKIVVVRAGDFAKATKAADAPTPKP